MKITRCDRCRRTPEEEEPIEYWDCIELGTIDAEWDICPECILTLALWMALPPKKKAMK